MEHLVSSLPLPLSSLPLPLSTPRKFPGLFLPPPLIRPWPVTHIPVQRKWFPYFHTPEVPMPLPPPPLSPSIQSMDTIVGFTLFFPLQSIFSTFSRSMRYLLTPSKTSLGRGPCEPSTLFPNLCTLHLLSTHLALHLFLSLLALPQSQNFMPKLHLKFLLSSSFVFL